MPQNLPNILFARAFPARLRQRINPAHAVIGPFDPPIKDHLTPDAAAAVRVLVTVGVFNTPALLMDLLPNLGLICCLGSGYEGVDIAAAKRRGIMVTHSPGANAAAVAELAMALLLAANRNILLADKFVRDGSWNESAVAKMAVTRGLAGRRIGIYGLGAIGLKIAARAAAFEAEIAYHGRAAQPGAPYLFHPTLQSLAEWADVLMVAVRATASNRGIVDAKVMRALGPQGILVNITRGSVVDETALSELLRTGELGSAGLDVFEHEPAVPQALTAIPHVVLTPHIGGRTAEAFEAMQDAVVANIDAFLTDQTVVTPIPEMQSK